MEHVLLVWKKLSSLARTADMQIGSVQSTPFMDADCARPNPNIDDD